MNQKLANHSDHHENTLLTPTKIKISKALLPYYNGGLHKLKDMHKRPKLDEEWQAIQELFLTKVKATDENYQTKERQSTRKRTKMLK